MAGKLEGKVAIVTGAGQGIGKGIAFALAREGTSVTIVELNADRCAKTAEEIRSIGAKALEAVCDVRKRDQVAGAVEATVRQFGTVDIVVNNAQAMRNNVPFEETTDEDMALALQSGLMGTFYFMQACFPYLKNTRGKIINIGSAAGTEGHPGWASYAAAKEGIRALTRVAAREWGKYGINVNTICPLASTPNFQAWANSDPQTFSWMLSTVPLRRMGDPELDIGRAVVFLASSDADYITGHTLMVDGGQTIIR